MVAPGLVKLAGVFGKDFFGRCLALICVNLTDPICLTRDRNFHLFYFIGVWYNGSSYSTIAEADNITVVFQRRLARYPKRSSLVNYLKLVQGEEGASLLWVLSALLYTSTGQRLTELLE